MKSYGQQRNGLQACVMSIKYNKAILFDIDGTLLDCHGAGRDALVSAAKEILGRTDYAAGIDFNGRTDSFIFAKIAEHLTGGDRQNKMMRLKTRYIELLGATIHKYENTVLSGVPELLQILAPHETILVGLLTGNFKDGAMIKLANAGIDKFFAFGVFGDETENRSDMPPIAQKLISEKYGEELPFTKIIIVGDTVHDIDCAKNNGAVSFCVGTGKVNQRELAARKPDYYAESFADYAAVADMLLNA